QNKQGSGDLQSIVQNSVEQDKSIKPYSDLGQKALDFARNKLKEHADITSHKFKSSRGGFALTNQPTNPEIALLTTLFWKLNGNLLELLKKNTKNPWSDQEIVTAADECMKIAYAISNLTLDDLKSFTEALFSKSDEDRTYAVALTRQDSYQYRTFYCCTNIYHMVRGEITWGPIPWEKNKEDFYHPEISEVHAKTFYQNGTIQNSWNQLYNEYCDRIRMYVTEKNLGDSDTRHINWTKKDIGIQSFTPVPDTRPT
ncbi:MAG: hypothetical protein Q8K60_02335, partial [Parachlamydiaceae bacterium]|nr:hypothetical protein [Parachlamydiaceae bacterium]